MNQKPPHWMEVALAQPAIRVGGAIVLILAVSIVGGITLAGGI